MQWACQILTMIEAPKFTEQPYPCSGEDSHLTLQDWEMAGEEEKRDAAPNQISSWMPLVVGLSDKIRYTACYSKSCQIRVETHA